MLIINHRTNNENTAQRKIQFAFQMLHVSQYYRIIPFK